jgi:MerR family transcriptional regulator, redox-sensitive transcriptional activator SoxR
MSMLLVMSHTIVVKVDLMSSQDRSMSIGAVAAQAGRRPSSIRYYEQIGLLPRPDRVSGRRVYGPETVRTLAVIETGQRAGLTLDEIRDLLAAASDGNQAAIERLREVALKKLPEVRELIERTEIVRDWLEAAARCECPTLDECPLFDDPALLPRKTPGLLYVQTRVRTCSCTLHSRLRIVVRGTPVTAYQLSRIAFGGELTHTI